MSFLERSNLGECIKSLPNSLRKLEYNISGNSLGSNYESIKNFREGIM